MKPATISRVRRVAVESASPPRSKAIDVSVFDSPHGAADAEDHKLRLKEDWKAMKVPLYHLSTEVVDSYQKLLIESPEMPKDVLTLDSLYWYVLMHQVKAGEEFQARVETFKGKRFDGKTRVLWVVYGFGHFAVLDISLTKKRIEVYDSIPDMAKEWVTPRLQRLLRSVVGGKVNFAVELKESAQQVNYDDCGVYAMANMRSLLFGREVFPKSMVGKHMGNARRESEVTKLRLKFFKEYTERKLSKWW